MVFGHVHEAVVVQHVDGRHRRRSRYRRGARAVGRPGGVYTLGALLSVLFL